MGTYLHGLFDDGQLARLLAKQYGEPELDQPLMTLAQFREWEFDRLVVRSSVDMEKVYRIIREED